MVFFSLRSREIGFKVIPMSSDAQPFPSKVQVQLLHVETEKEIGRFSQCALHTCGESIYSKGWGLKEVPTQHRHDEL